MASSKTKNDKINYLKGAEAETRILEYLIEQNRPHNATDISANLRVVKKADVLKCLTYLHESQKIDMKLFGKQAVYCCKQSSQSAVSPEVLKEMQTEQEDLKRRTKELKENNVKIQAELAELEKLPPTSEIPIVKSELKQSWIELQSRLAAFASDEANREKEKVDLKTPEEISKLELQIEKYKTLWLSHRKICKQSIRVIQDVLKDDDAKSNFLEQIGLEDDSAELSSLEQEQIRSNNTVSATGLKPEPRRPSHPSAGIKRSFSGSIKV
ncbi:hypothetical protein PCANC_01607 [Puccinia coronata f. sp. avenae]|uniref:Homologous-pairing protein 2 winged helix domain-containing protein n=1 Tax=Puccinia coronata f. sp. avenae TaxID=200324 RepID=A0A2N5W0R6_9BASI|nr:hypothetical protein PCANC_01607 [Puccinia coronata f. sp. avenae]